MSGFLIGLFTVVLVLASLFIILLVLLQRGQGQGGMGSAFGGGMAESAFGGDTNRVLTRATVGSAIVFFVVGLGLYMGQLARHGSTKDEAPSLEKIVTQAQTESAGETTATTPAPGEVTTKAMEVLDKEAPVATPVLTPAIVEEPKNEVVPAATVQ